MKTRTTTTTTTSEVMQTSNQWIIRIPFICLSWLNGALESVPHLPNSVSLNCLPSFWLYPFCFWSVSGRKSLSSSAGEALLSLQASGTRLHHVFFFFFLTLRTRSVTSPGGWSHLHTHWVFASDAYLIRPGNAAISAQLRGKSVTRLSDMQMGGEKKKIAGLLNTCCTVVGCRLAWRLKFKTLHDKIWEIYLTNELWCKYQPFELKIQGSAWVRASRLLASSSLSNLSSFSSGINNPPLTRPSPGLNRGAEGLRAFFY